MLLHPLFPIRELSLPPWSLCFSNKYTQTYTQTNKPKLRGQDAKVVPCLARVHSFCTFGEMFNEFTVAH